MSSHHFTVCFSLGNNISSLSLDSFVPCIFSALVSHQVLGTLALAVTSVIMTQTDKEQANVLSSQVLGFLSSTFCMR